MYGGSATYQCPTFLVSDCRSLEHSLSTLPGPGALGPIIFFYFCARKCYHTLLNSFCPMRSLFAQVPWFWPKREVSILDSSLGPFTLQSHALLTVTLSHEIQCFYLNFEANEILYRFLLVYKYTGVNWISVHFLSVVLVVSRPLQKSVKFSRFLH